MIPTSLMGTGPTGIPSVITERFAGQSKGSAISYEFTQIYLGGPSPVQSAGLTEKETGLR